MRWGSVSSERLVRRFKGVCIMFSDLFKSRCGLFRHLGGSLGGGLVKSLWDRLSLSGLGMGGCGFGLGGCGLSLGGCSFILEGHGLRLSGQSFQLLTS